MISIARLRRSLTGHRVVCDQSGEVLDIETPDDIGPAALLVSPVTDALKTVDDSGRVTGSVDRSAMWLVDAIVLDSVALDRLEDDRFTFDGLLKAVRNSGLVWEVRSTSVP